VVSAVFFISYLSPLQDCIFRLWECWFALVDTTPYHFRPPKELLWDDGDGGLFIGGEFPRRSYFYPSVVLPDSPGRVPTVGLSGGLSDGQTCLKITFLFPFFIFLYTPCPPLSPRIGLSGLRRVGLGDRLLSSQGFSSGSLLSPPPIPLRGTRAPEPRYSVIDLPFFPGVPLVFSESAVSPR